MLNAFQFRIQKSIFDINFLFTFDVYHMANKDESDLVMVSNESETDSNPRKRQGTLLSFFTKSIKCYIISKECLFITNDLHWGKHIEEICNRSYRTLGLLKRNLSSCPMEVKLQAYKGLIRTVLEYDSTAWDPHQSYL